MNRVLVTGGTGFVGQALCPILLKQGLRVSVATRSPRVAETIGRVDVRPIPGVGPRIDWSVVLRDVEVIVHLAARVPNRMDNHNPQFTGDYQRVNVEGARKLGEDAVAAGVRRMIYVSTATIHGARTAPSQAFQESDPPAPADVYAQSKWKAEQALAEVAQQSNLELVILRPPLVYGPGVKGDFLTLLRRIAKARTLPVIRVAGGFPNRRSLLYVNNLCDAIVRCMTAPDAAGGIFLIRDSEDPTVADIFRTLAQGMAKDIRIVPVPQPLFRLASRLTGNSAAIEPVSASFCIDDSAIRRQLKWTPSHSVVEGLNATAAWFAASSH